MRNRTVEQIIRTDYKIVKRKSCVEKARRIPTSKRFMKTVETEILGFYTLERLPGYVAQPFLSTQQRL